jgi:hypothetical protein
MAAQTAYAELLDLALAAELSRSVASLTGNFAAKSVKGRRYWYYQHRDLAGAVRQFYVGPDDERVRELVQRAHSPAATDLAARVRALIALGGERVLPKHFRVIRRLSEYGFFRAGGVLVGTHAFLSCGNLLGVHWEAGSRTQDLDFAHAGKNISIALPSTIRVDVPRAIDSLELGLLPLATIGGASAVTYLNPEDAELRLDFLTTLHRGGDAPIVLPQLNLSLQPLRFMEYVLEDPTQAVVFCEDGAVVVTLPAPERYALHKLLVFGERAAAFRTKANKDILQAAALIGYLATERREELRRAWADLIGRGRGWVARARRGIAALAAAAPGFPVAKLLPLP